MKKNKKLMRVVLWILIIFMVVGMVLPAIMFHSFAYPKDETTPLKSYFTKTVMDNGVIKFKPQPECEIVNTLSSYTFKTPGQVKSVDDELKEYDAMEKGEG